MAENSIRVDPEQFGSPEPHLSCSSDETLIDLFMSEWSEAADSEKRLNVRIEQLTKLVQTLTEKVVDLEFRSKSENEAIARKSPSKSKQMKLGASNKGGKNTQSYGTVCGCTRSEYEAAPDDPFRLPFEENQRTERTGCRSSNRSTCTTKRNPMHNLQSDSSGDGRKRLNSDSEAALRLPKFENMDENSDASWNLVTSENLQRARVSCLWETWSLPQHLTSWKCLLQGVRQRPSA